MTAQEVLVAVFTPPGVNERRWLDECTRYCERHQLRVLTITRDRATAARLALLGDVDRVIVAHPAHIELMMPPVEVIYDRPYDPDRPQRLTPPGQRRPRRTDRPRWRNPDKWLGPPDEPEVPPMERRTRRKRPQWGGPGPPLDPRTR